MKAFISNNLIIDKEFFFIGSKLIYYYNNNDEEKNEINLKLPRFKYKELDFTIIEILNEDNISSYWEIDEYINSENFKDNKICSFQFPKNQNLEYSKGKHLGNINNYFLYSIGADEGSSGSPILLLKNGNLIWLHKDEYK